MRFVLTVLLTALLALPLRADDAAREAAIDAWLADDDATALPALAALAQAGDTRAALLLHVLEMRTPSPFQAGLSPADRRAIFRAPGTSKLGTPWLKAADPAGAPDLHAALVATQAGDWAAALDAALAAGDMALAREAAVEWGNFDPMTLVARDARDPLPAPLRPMLWMLAGPMRASLPPDPHLDALRAEFDALPDGPTKRLVLGADPAAAPADRLLWRGILDDGEPEPMAETLATLAALLAAAPEARAAKALCDSRCPDDPQGCLTAVNASFYGLFWLSHFSTPLAAVIPEDRYSASLRAQEDLLRAAADTRPMIDTLPLTTGSACLKVLLPGP